MLLGFVAVVEHSGVRCMYVFPVFLFDGIFVYSCYWNELVFMSFHYFRNFVERDSKLTAIVCGIYYHLDGVIVQYRGWAIIE